MDRALTGGLGAGSSLALGLRLLDSFSSAPVIPFADPCPLVESHELHWASLVVGILVGLVLGPLLEAVVALRSWALDCALRRLAWAAAQETGKPLYKIG